MLNPAESRTYRFAFYRRDGTRRGPGYFLGVIFVDVTAGEAQRMIGAGADPWAAAAEVKISKAGIHPGGHSTPKQVPEESPVPRLRNLSHQQVAKLEGKGPK